MSTVAWVLRKDGTVDPVEAVRLSVWPGTAVVTHPDGATEQVLRANLLAADDLDRHWAPSWTSD